MKKQFICIVCPAGCHLVWEDGRVSGNECKRGVDYAVTEMTAPKRQVSSTVALKGSNRHTRLPVRTDRAIDKKLVAAAVKELDGVVVETPVRAGDIIKSDAAKSGVNFIATRSVQRR